MPIEPNSTHDAAEVRGERPRKVIFIEQLSELIGKTPTTIRTCSTNAKYEHLIPRPFKMPNSRRLCWFEHEVMDWIESQRPVDVPAARRARGRPTKVEQLRRAAKPAEAK